MYKFKRKLVKEVQSASKKIQDQVAKDSYGGLSMAQEEKSGALSVTEDEKSGSLSKPEQQ